MAKGESRTPQRPDLPGLASETLGRRFGGGIFPPQPGVFGVRQPSIPRHGGFDLVGQAGVGDFMRAQFQPQPGGPPVRQPAPVQSASQFRLGGGIPTDPRVSLERLNRQLPGGFTGDRRLTPEEHASLPSFGGPSVQQPLPPPSILQPPQPGPSVRQPAGFGNPLSRALNPGQRPRAPRRIERRGGHR